MKALSLAFLVLVLACGKEPTPPPECPDDDLTVQHDEDDDCDERDDRGA